MTSTPTSTTLDERIASLEAATDALRTAIQHLKDATNNTAFAPHTRRFLISKLERAIDGETHSIAALYNDLMETYE